MGFVYVAFVIDAIARRIVGWRAARSMHGLGARCLGVGVVVADWCRGTGAS